jgi:hypothetical protein
MDFWKKIVIRNVRIKCQLYIYFSVLWTCFICWEKLRTIYLFSSSIKLKNIKCVGLRKETMKCICQFFMSSLEVWLLPAVKYIWLTINYLSYMIVWLGCFFITKITIYAHTEILSARLLIILSMARYSWTFIFSLFSYQR